MAEQDDPRLDISVGEAELNLVGAGVRASTLMTDLGRFKFPGKISIPYADEGPSRPVPGQGPGQEKKDHRSPSPIRVAMERAIDEYEAQGKTYVLAKEKKDADGRFIVDPAQMTGFADYVWPGVNMSDIARSTGLTLGGVSRIFNGRRKARKFTLVSIANLYQDGDVKAVVQTIVDRITTRLKYPENKNLTDKARNELIRVLGLYQASKY